MIESFFLCIHVVLSYTDFLMIFLLLFLQLLHFWTQNNNFSLLRSDQFCKLIVFALHNHLLHHHCLLRFRFEFQVLVLEKLILAVITNPHEFVCLLMFTLLSNVSQTYRILAKITTLYKKYHCFFFSVRSPQILQFVGSDDCSGGYSSALRGRSIT
jgi:hypothetical protein